MRLLPSFNTANVKGHPEEGNRSRRRNAASSFTYGFEYRVNYTLY